MRKSYLFLCALFAAYTLYIYAAASDPPGAEAYRTEAAMRGRKLFREKNCIACHQIYGLGGYMGPDLTNVISSPGKGELYARAFIQNGTLKMPAFGLKNEEVDDLVAFLKLVDASGKYSPSETKADWTGWSVVPGDEK